jgi:hypothetical protein
MDAAKVVIHVVQRDRKSVVLALHWKAFVSLVNRRLLISQSQILALGKCGMISS